MLIGNPADFDRIRARYEALKYPTPEQAAFNATRASYEGLLTGSGFDTTMVPTTTPGQQVSFSVDPNTGQVTTQIPQYEVPAFETLYDAGGGLIGTDGLPSAVASTSMGGGQALSATPQRGGGDGYENLQKFLGNRPGISNEVFGNTALRINEDGTVSVIDRDTLDYDFTKAMDTITDFGILGALKGDETYGEALDRIEKDYGKKTADEVALNVKEQYAAHQYTNNTKSKDTPGKVSIGKGFKDKSKELGDRNKGKGPSTGGTDTGKPGGAGGNYGGGYQGGR